MTDKKRAALTLISNRAAAAGADRPSEQLTQMFQRVDDETRAKLLDTLTQEAASPRYNVLLSWLLLRRGRTEEALRILEKLALLNPEDPHLFRTLALALAKNGDKALAREVALYA